MNARRSSIALADLVALDDVAGLGRGLDDVVNERVDAARAGLSEQLDLLSRQVAVRRSPARSASSMSWLM